MNGTLQFLKVYPNDPLEVRNADPKDSSRFKDAAAFTEEMLGVSLGQVLQQRRVVDRIAGVVC
jgi:hypothetical protein